MLQTKLLFYYMEMNSDFHFTLTGNTNHGLVTYLEKL